MKTCTKCSVGKPLSEFVRSGRSKDGRAPACKECEHERLAAWRTEHRQEIRNKQNARRRNNNEEYRRRDKEKYRRNPARHIQHSRNYRLRYPDKRHNADLRAKYGLTRDDYNQMLAAQGGGCALCGIKPSEQSGRPTHKNVLYVDHDHVTGKVRGLLCNKHNRAIGLFGDDPDALINAAMYLAEHSGRLWLEMPKAA